MMKSSQNRHVICSTQIGAVMSMHIEYEGWNFNSGNYLFTNDKK